MNKAYSATGIYFALREVVLWRNDSIAAHCNTDHSDVFRTQVVTAFEGNQASDVEVVTVVFCVVEYLGEATFPWMNKEHDPAPYVQISWAAMQGNSPASGPHGGGKTLVHEMGHFFGLLHPFPVRRSCDQDPDFVHDTPIQFDSAVGCPIGRDSCPNAAGEDPIHNYMGYSDDSCMTEFTAGQVERMQQIIRKYRPKLYSQGLFRGTCQPDILHTNCHCARGQCSAPFTSKTDDLTRTRKSNAQIDSNDNPDSKLTCNGHGNFDADQQSCTCEEQFTGVNCEWCTKNHYGENCNKVFERGKSKTSITSTSAAITDPTMSLAIVMYQALPRRPDNAADPQISPPKGLLYVVDSSFVVVATYNNPENQHATDGGEGAPVQSVVPYLTPTPVAVEVNYASLVDKNKDIDPSKLELWFYSGGQWLQNDTVCDGWEPTVLTTENKTITATLCHLGQFAMFGPPGANTTTPNSANFLYPGHLPWLAACTSVFLVRLGM
eukprot:TRINITY_DN14243_c0_g1_i1.p1 TRINITY_DN14243_c0_g1~~TRINITY_DN14243_c0_g1_i1.p1  ORF type:complete len:561 (+),score=28.25 TRINITY_DN14243_c0_g1_i1:210-1685(+)